MNTMLSQLPARFYRHAPEDERPPSREPPAERPDPLYDLRSHLPRILKKEEARSK